MPTNNNEVVNVCPECEGDGWVNDYMGGCGDPECCGGPVRVPCQACTSTQPEE